MAIIQWIISNYEVILTALGGLVSVASIITGLTSTKSDDKVVGVIKKFLGHVSVLTHADAAGTLKAPFASPDPEAPLMFERTRK